MLALIVGSNFLGATTHKDEYEMAVQPSKTIIVHRRFFNLGAYADSPQLAIDPERAFLFLAIKGGVRIYSISNPVEPKLLRTIPQKLVGSISYHQGILYGFAPIDDPEHPNALAAFRIKDNGEYELCSFSENLEYNKDIEMRFYFSPTKELLFVLTVGAFLYIFDIHDKTNLRLLKDADLYKVLGQGDTHFYHGEFQGVRQMAFHPTEDYCLMVPKQPVASRIPVMLLNYTNASNPRLETYDTSSFDAAQFSVMTDCSTTYNIVSNGFYPRLYTHWFETIDWRNASQPKYHSIKSIPEVAPIYLASFGIPFRPNLLFIYMGSVGVINLTDTEPFYQIGPFGEPQMYCERDPVVFDTFVFTLKFADTGQQHTIGIYELVEPTTSSPPAEPTFNYNWFYLFFLLLLLPLGWLLSKLLLQGRS